MIADLENLNTIFLVDVDMSKPGPTCRRLSLLAKGLSENDTISEVLTIFTTCTNPKIQQNQVFCNDFGIRCFYLPVKKFRYFYFLLSVYYSFKIFGLIHKIKPKVIIIGQTIIYRYIPVFIWANLFHSKILCDFTEWYPTSPHRFLSPVFREHFLFRSFFYKFLTGSISISQYYHNYFSMNNHPSIHIPALTDYKSYEDNQHKIGPLQVTYVGRFSKRDMPFLMLDALDLLSRDCNNISFNIVGKINSDTYSKSVLKYVENKDSLSSIVNFTGFITEEQYQYYLNKTDIFILLHSSSVFSKACFPTRIPEFMITRRPIVTSAMGDINYYLTHKHDSILIEPDSDANTIYKEMLSLAKNPDLRFKIGENAYNTATTYFSYSKNADNLVQFIKTIK